MDSPITNIETSNTIREKNSALCMQHSTLGTGFQKFKNGRRTVVIPIHGGHALSRKFPFMVVVIALTTARFLSYLMISVVMES